MSSKSNTNKFMKRMVSFLIILAYLAVFIPVIASQDSGDEVYHYVRQGANGDGSSWENAYGSLPENLIRGHTYYIADGVYDGYTCNTAEDGTSVITIKKATVSDHGSSIGWDDSYGDGQAVFNGMIEFTTSYWVFDGQTGGGAGNWNSGFGFKIYEPGDRNNMIRISYTGKANNILIKHVEFEGKGSVSTAGGNLSNDAVAIFDANNITISHFWMYDIGRCPFFLSAQDVIIEHGYVESYYGSPEVHSEIASIWAFDGIVGDITFRYNLFTDIKSTGGLMWDNGSNPEACLYVYGNVFYKPEGATWERANGLIGGWRASEFHNCHVYNNTFINVDQECLSTFPNVYSGNKAYNNLFYNCNSPNFVKFESHDYNLFINSGDTHSEENGVSYKGEGGDPFINQVGLDFGLIGATAPGMALPSPFDTDPTGAARGADGLWDRGAFESNTLIPIPTPIPTPEDDPILSVFPDTVVPGGTVTVSFSNVKNPTVADWIGMYTIDAEDGTGTNWTAIDWFYTSSGTTAYGSEAKSSGSFTVTMPDEEGEYNFRLFKDDMFDKLATSNTVTVMVPPPLDMVFSLESISLKGKSKIIGNTGTNSDDAATVTFSGSAGVEGDLLIGPGADWTEVVKSTKPDASANVTGTITNLASVRRYQPPQFPEIPVDLEYRGDLIVRLSPQTPYIIDNSGSYGNIKVYGLLTINVGEEDIKIVTDNLTVTGNGRIVVNRTGEGRLLLYVKDKMEIGGNDGINKNGNYNDVILYYSGSETLNFKGNNKITGSLYVKDSDIIMSGSASISGHIVTGGSNVVVSGNAEIDAGLFYAPNADLSLSGGGKIRGVTVAKSIHLSGNSLIICDGSMEPVSE